jgi:hypothetical protein
MARGNCFAATSDEVRTVVLEPDGDRIKHVVDSAEFLAWFASQLATLALSRVNPPPACLVDHPYAPAGRVQRCQVDGEARIRPGRPGTAGRSPRHRPKGNFQKTNKRLVLSYTCLCLDRPDEESIMRKDVSNPSISSCHTLRFDAIAGEGFGYAFPCDPSGRVDIDRLSERQRVDFLFARHLVGLLFQRPLVAQASVV